MIRGEEIVPTAFLNTQLAVTVIVSKASKEGAATDGRYVETAEM
jgi:hypothetical protein